MVQYFKISIIVPYLNKHHASPVTADPLHLDHLVPIAFSENGEVEYKCSVMKEVFNQVCAPAAPRFRKPWACSMCTCTTVLEPEAHAAV